MTNKTRYDVAGIGNAIVDVQSFTDDAFLDAFKLNKGTMTLIDEARAEELYKVMGPATECSGGSVANTVAGIASLGGRACYMGKVKNDQLGGIFRHDLTASGVHFDTPPASTGKATARCMIFVTPDAQRTMNTYIGACTGLSESDIDEKLIADSAITYIEGYLWDEPKAKAAIRKAMDVARKYGRKIAFSLSDPFCVERHRDEFLALLEGSIDILFANEHEIMSLFDIADLAPIAGLLQPRVEVAAITRSEKGSVVVSKSGVDMVEAEPVHKVVDTTGAGDLYAAGFLYGYTQGWSLRGCAELGGRCAGQIIAQLGARSQKRLTELLAAA